jgi:hypothetical protein
MGPPDIVVSWYRIPESQEGSGRVRLSTVVTVGSGRFRWVPTGLRVRTRVQRVTRRASKPTSTRSVDGDWDPATVARYRGIQDARPSSVVSEDRRGGFDHGHEE